MNTRNIETVEDGKIGAELVRFGKTFVLVAYHMHKAIPRAEALELKNKYGMQAIPTGYKGVVDKSAFIGGKKMVITN